MASRPDPEPAPVVDRVGSEDLDDALGALAHLVLGAESLESSLGRIATMAARAIPAAEGAGLAMFEPARRETVCVSADFVREIDAFQNDVAEGPGITAAAEARTIVCADLRTDPRWPRFGRGVAARGVRSVLSLPLLLADEVVGALSVYAHGPGAFDGTAPAQGEVFAAAAAVTVHNARQLARAERTTAHLRAALTHRAVIDQAIGILMSRQGGSADEAFAALRRMSQADNVKLAQVAQAVVDEAVRRARARRDAR